MLRCGIAATLAAASIAALTGSQVSRAAIPATSQNQPAAGSAATKDESAPPAASVAMGAFRVIRGWLDSWVVPPSAPGPGERDGLPSCAGAAVVLRYEGKSIGRGAEMVLALPGDRDQLTERVVWRVLLAAFAEADRRLPVPNDARRAENAKELGKDVTISLELAGALTPIVAETFADLDLQIAPGIDGVAVRLNNRVEAAFPSTMLLSNTTPAQAARTLVSKITGSAETALAEARDLREKHKVTFLKFRAVHLVQTQPREEPRFAYRGGVIVDRGQIDSGFVQLMADNMARNLALRLGASEAPLGLRGTYRPWSGEYASASAPPREQALAALALRRYARLGGGTPGGAKAAVEAADRILHELDDIDLDEVKPWDDAATAALCVLALRESTGLLGSEIRQSHVDLLARCTATVRGSFDAGKGFRPEIPAPARAAIAAALLRIEGARESGVLAVRQCFKDTPPAALPGMMPLLGWAEIEAAGGGMIPAAGALRQFRTQLWQSQIAAEDAPADRLDLAGGIAFEAGGLPTWQCLRPLALAATMLRVPELTPKAEVPTEVGRLLSALRFARQLQIDGHSAWMCASPPAALGGVRAAPFDQSMPTDATATGLLLVCEVMESLRALK